METKSGMIVQAHNASYEIYCEDGMCYSCKPRGNFRYRKLSPYVGDRVRISLQGDGSATIEEIFERKNCFLRPPISNLDCMIVAVSAKDPAPNLHQLDHLLAIFENKRIQVLLVVTKADLDPSGAQELAATYRRIGYEVLVSDVLGSTREELLAFLKGHSNQTVAFCGNSGVGKSTLCNLLFPDLSLKTGAVSDKTARGRHTTRHVTLYPFANLFGDGGKQGFLADTPGFTLIDFEKFDFFPIEELAQAFVDFSPYLSRCRYNDCTHTKEEDCAIIRAIRKNEVLSSRHESYLQLYEILKNKKKWER